MSQEDQYLADSPKRPSEGPYTPEITGDLDLDAKLRVLLVEDDEADAYLISRALAGIPRVGSVVHAKDGVEALEMIDAGMVDPDLAIVDLQMPRKNGFTLLLDFAARDSAQFPAVVLTSSRGGADAYRSKKRGADHFLTKPNSIEKLTSELERVIAAV